MTEGPQYHILDGRQDMLALSTFAHAIGKQVAKGAVVAIATREAKNTERAADRPLGNPTCL